jgi:hypothetical protein
MIAPEPPCVGCVTDGRTLTGQGAEDQHAGYDLYRFQVAGYRSNPLRRHLPRSGFIRSCWASLTRYRTVL